MIGAPSRLAVGGLFTSAMVSVYRWRRMSGDIMSLKAMLLAICLAIASFGALSVVAPGEALAHPGHHTPAAAGEQSHPDVIAPDALAALVDAADDVADGGCLTSCCVGASCCPATHRQRS